jgi:hypothetical protein
MRETAAAFAAWEEFIRFLPACLRPIGAEPVSTPAR